MVIDRLLCSTMRVRGEDEGSASAVATINGRSIQGVRILVPNLELQVKSARFRSLSGFLIKQIHGGL